MNETSSVPSATEPLTDVELDDLIEEVRDAVALWLPIPTEGEMSMTWSINVTGHIEDRSQEKEIADLIREDVQGIAAKLKDYGLSAANFYGNEHHENFLEEQPSA